MLNTSWTPSYTEILNAAKEIYKETLDDDSVLEYLSEVASYDYACPDKCDQCAVDFFNENEDEIYGTHEIVKEKKNVFIKRQQTS